MSHFKDHFPRTTLLEISVRGLVVSQRALKDMHVIEEHSHALKKYIALEDAENADIFATAILDIANKFINEE